MASFLARRALCQVRPSVHFLRPAYGVRTIRVTAIAQKKGKNDAVVEDLFPEDTSGDLFSDTAAPAAADTAPLTPQASAGTKAAIPDSNRKRTKISPERRSKRFEELASFIKPRIGRKPAFALPKIRHTAWIQLVRFSHTKEELERVAEMFSGWREAGNEELKDEVVELFVRRCEQVQYPDLALKVFGDYAKYQVKLSLPAARNLLHSVHLIHPMDKVMTASALYGVYGLTPVAQDLVSCSMMIVACWKANTKESNEVARALVPSLKSLLEAPEQSSTSSATSTLPSLWVPAHAAWMKWTLKKVDKVLSIQNNGKREAWLVDWRVRNRHLADASHL
ncbi:hypothetical protein BDN72DRAFT_837489 [Pluteus cervinus]|uniref:Uncharacterized protein n=1 Tax=Pluteus cervinus TaxID=181527 RepID=A0ACD3B1V9_9AGAR|nr:hypothetical protein BDN72DRAFT_837489 [Pluteus cervinus]